MQVIFKYFAQIRRTAGVESELVEIADGSTIAVCLAKIATKRGPELRATVFDESGNIRSSLIVLLNGVPVSRETARPLSDGDQVSLLGAVAGG